MISLLFDKALNYATNKIFQEAVSSYDTIISYDPTNGLAYKEKGMNIDEGIKWVKNKMERDWKKMSEKSRNIYKEKYENIIKIIG